jgi:hypothetical protein
MVRASEGMNMQVNVQLLDKLKRAHRQAASINRALWSDAQDAERRISHLRGQLQSAQARLTDFPRGGRLPDGTTESEWRQQRAEAQQGRYADEARLRRTVGPEAFAQHIGAMTEATAADFELAVIEAAQALTKSEARAAEIQESQQAAGNRAGLLRATLDAARTWLLANGHGELVEGL